nr:unnamed protein product [Callosobruchus analis]
MSKRSYNSDLEKEDHVIKRQRKKEKFDKLQREMETLQRKIDLFSSDSSSVSEKTMKQYNTVFTRWWEFCIKNTIEPFEYNLSGIISFIKSILDKDFSFSSINTHRSALSLVIDIPEKDKSIVSRYFKSIYNLKTPTPKYSFTWDPSLVLVYLEKLYPIEQLSLEKLSHKLVMLMALTSAHRLQTISLIKFKTF